jgi:hypothetical protein
VLSTHTERTQISVSNGREPIVAGNGKRHRHGAGRGAASDSKRT